MKTSPKPEFWVANISPMNVTLADLAISIKAFTVVNLLDRRHYEFTLEQLIKSRDSGSMFVKRDKIIPRKSAPYINKDTVLLQQEAVIPSRERSVFSLKETEYDELKVSEDKAIQKRLDEEYANENAELAELDLQKTSVPKRV